MKNIRRFDVHSQPIEERRKQARTEDEETEGMIRRYMRLAEAASQEPEAAPMVAKPDFGWRKAG